MLRQNRLPFLRDEIQVGLVHVQVRKLHVGWRDVDRAERVRVQMPADDEIQISDTATSSNLSFESKSDSQDVIDKSDELPKIKVQKSLEFLNSKIVASADQEAIDFFIASKRNSIWAKVFEDDFYLETLIICPKNLMHMWEDYVHKYQLRAKVIPISQVQNLLPKMRRYRLVIIDESHNLRNREGKQQYSYRTSHS